MTKSDSPADLRTLRCFVFDFGFTLSSQRYFTVCPPECPDWVELFQKHVFSGDTHLFDRWMDGAIGAEDVASLMAPIVGMAERDVLDCMERGLVGLHTNAAVVKLANAVKRMGKRTILVTGNIDLFDTIVVPDLDLASTFDVIVNSSRSKSSFKLSLWDEAFALLNDGVNYHNSFLIEDSRKNVELFRAAGGRAHHYLGDEALTDFLNENRFPSG